MDGKPESKFLRFNVPIDPVDDADLVDRFNAIPNGLRQTVMKMALTRLLPNDEAALQALLGEALMEQSRSGRKRGRPPGGSDKVSVARPVAQVAMPPPQVQAPAVVVSPMPVEAPSVEAVVQKNELQKFAPLLGGMSWEP